jgi:hypothetical protein
MHSPPWVAGGLLQHRPLHLLRTPTRRVATALRPCECWLVAAVAPCWLLQRVLHPCAYAYAVGPHRLAPVGWAVPVGWVTGKGAHWQG